MFETLLVLSQARPRQHANDGFKGAKRDHEVAQVLYKVGWAGVGAATSRYHNRDADTTTTRPAPQLGLDLFKTPNPYYIQLTSSHYRLPIPNVSLEGFTVALKKTVVVGIALRPDAVCHRARKTT